MSRQLAASFVMAMTLLSAACATTGATPRPFPVPAPTASASAPPPSTPAPVTGTVTGTVPDPPAAVRPAGPALAYSLTGTALNLRGTPYRNGGTDPTGFDCSGLVKYVFAQNGIDLPRTVEAQYHAGQPVAADHLEPGDLVFFSTVAPGATHVGILIGGDEFVHAPSGTGQVRVERLSGAYWSTRFVGARRVI